MAKQVLDIRAGKGMTTSQSNEFLRNANGGERLKRWSGNYDSTREHLNFEIKKGGVVCEVDKKTSVPKRIKILERGDRISETGARHCSTEEYHAELREKLMSENEQQSQTIEGQQTVIREQRATLSGLEKDIKHATARFKALQTMIANLESKKNRLLEEVEQLKRDVIPERLVPKRQRSGLIGFRRNWKRWMRKLLTRLKNFILQNYSLPSCKPRPSRLRESLKRYRRSFRRKCLCSARPPMPSTG